MGEAPKLVLPNVDLKDSARVLGSLRDDVRGFEKLAVQLKLLTGIHLPVNEKNLILMAGRLLPLLRQRGIETYAGFLDLVVSRDRAAIDEFIVALTTNTTEFFRESRHFDTFRDALGRVVRQKQESGAAWELRLWCVPCSTGQEPYSLAIAMLEALPALNAWTVKFLASDINREVLAQAASGVFTENEMRMVPGLYRQKYFRPVKFERGRGWEVVPSVRNLITFAPFNLTDASYPFKFGFDFIFCRNVLIYFDRATIDGVLTRLVQQLHPGGFLFLGHSETGMVKSDVMTTVASAVYQKRLGRS